MLGPVTRSVTFDLTTSQTTSMLTLISKIYFCEIKTTVHSSSRVGFGVINDF